MAISQEVRQKLLAFQNNEITEHHIYLKLAGVMKSPENRQVMQKIAQEELDHCHFWQTYTGQEARPNWAKVWQYYLISRLFGFTFGAKLMEQGEEQAQDYYQQLRPEIADVDKLIHAEEEHEHALLNLLDEQSLRYTGSIVLGLNDALVELTGALAGLTLALQNTRLIALTGSITGIAAALSMAASEYLSTKSEETAKSPLQASLYTGVAYIITVLALILPYLLLPNLYVALACTMVIAIIIIAVFNYYIAIATDKPFKGRFWEMTGLSLSVAVLSFLVGYLIRALLGVDV